MILPAHLAGSPECAGAEIPVGLTGKNAASIKNPTTILHVPLPLRLGSENRMEKLADGGQRFVE